MDIISGIILGAIEGITEFLPVSSSGHLILAREFLGLQTVTGLSVDAVLQLATSLAILVYFRHDILRLLRTAISLFTRRETLPVERVLLYAVVVGTIPAAIVGFFLEGRMQTTFREPLLVAVMLLFGSLVLFVADRIGTCDKPLSVGRGLVIGFFQTLALLPGMSRSGASISGGLFVGLCREDAVRFSFLLAFPINIGSGLKKLLELGGNGYLFDNTLSIVFGALTAFVTGLLAIYILMRFVRAHRFTVFIAYRIALACFILILFL